MGGRKHHLQQFGYMNMDWNKIQDPIERDFAFRSLQATPYCKFCGEQILDADMDKDKSNVNWEWEQKNLMHYRCLQDDKHKRAEKARLEAVRAEIERQKAAEQFDWNAYMEQMLNKKED